MSLKLLVSCFKTLFFGGIFSFFLLLSLLTGCEKILPPEPDGSDLLEGPLEDLTQSQNSQFTIGDEIFGKIFSKDEGLGPVFIHNSCASCHIADGKGHPSGLVIRFGKPGINDFDYMPESGGPQLQDLSIPGHTAEILPSEATAISKRLAPGVTGLGFIGAIHDSSLLKYSDEPDLDGDGISGRPAYLNPGNNFIPEPIHIPFNGKYIGRFGKKASKITLLEQAVFALKNDIGITSDFDMEDVYNPKDGVLTTDNIADPELPAASVQNLVFYLRTLKVPPRRKQDEPEVMEGEKLFVQIGCNQCHVETFTTAKSDIAALSEKIIHPFSDFLLHDMGPGLDDGFPEGDAKSNEWRTAPLWGVGLTSTTQGEKTFFLHDGRATSLEQAISFHGGEAASRREAWYNLSDTQRSKIIRFLNSL